MSFRKRMLKHGPRTSVLAASIGALVASGGLSGVALAQEEDEAAEETETDDIIVVTGTRIRRDDFNATNATSVVTADDMRTLGVISVADMVNQLPNNIASVSPEANPGSPFNVGASIANLRGLNTFAGTRTLTMVDSRRMTATNNGGGVDMNFIPSALVGRIETVTGGAAATYGADAMAGVVNVILDDNIENIRVDLGYQTTAEGDGDRYNFSFATGTELFDGRGSFTVGIDFSDQESIDSCAKREYCGASRGILQNGSGVGTGFFGFGPPAPYSLREDVVFEGQPHWLILEGMRHTATTSGILLGDGFIGAGDTTIPGQDCPGYDPNLAIEDQAITLNNLVGVGYNGATNNGSGALECGAFVITPDGMDIMPYLESLTAEQRAGVDEEGFTGETPWGEGKGPYVSTPLRPESRRGNIFTRFKYELESGIELAADVSFGQTENRALQRRTSDNIQRFCVQRDNGYLVQSSPAMQAVFADRWATGAFGGVQTDWSIACDEPPFFGGSFLDDREDGRFDFRTGTVMTKDMSEHLRREQNNKTDVFSMTLNANGDLFDGGSWTWDTYYTYGKSESDIAINNWRSDNRMQMAIDSVFDPITGEVVCRINATDPNQREFEWWKEIVDINGVETGVYEDINAVANATMDGGSDIRDKWLSFYSVALKDEYPAAEIPAQSQIWFDQLSAGCSPFSPFGDQNLVPMSAEALAFAFPSIVESTEIEQNLLSLSFSGDLHRGIGAGPLLLAGGLDIRTEETFNRTGADPITARDFISNFDGTNAFGDNWAGKTTNDEMYAELEMPFLRDVPGADYLMMNIAKRRTKNVTERIEGRAIVDATSFQKFTRYVDSWKASMVWQPVELLTVRMTRSSDTRAPSARELFQTNTGAQQAGGQNELLSPFRANDPDTSTGENGDQYENVTGGNARLSAEKSTTETLGIVFTPAETVPGLEVALDYYETTIRGGIETVSSNGTLTRCAQEIADMVSEADGIFCRNIVFGVPDPDQVPILETYGCDYDDDAVPPVLTGCSPAEANQILPYTNILSISSSQVNVSPYWNRGMDMSLSYSKQLAGGGFISGRVLATRFLEQSVDLEGNRGRTNVAGQTGSNGLTNVFGSFGINYSPTPRIRGNMWMQYNKNAFTVSGQVFYTGKGRLNIQDGWISEGEFATYTENGVLQVAQYDPDIVDTVSAGALPSWATMNLNFNYDFARSRFAMDSFEGLSVFLNITNVGDRLPNFFSGRQAGGINTTYFSGMGREYNVGVRMEF